jgi:hypothetical protein
MIAPVVLVLVAMPRPAKGQSLVDSGDSAGAAVGAAPAQPEPSYTRPTQTTKVHNYVFDAFGPYPAVGAALTAVIGQAANSPPEWN